MKKTAGGKSMRRSLIAVLVLGLVAGSLSPATASKKKKKRKKPKRVERVVEVRYEFPAAIGVGGVGGACSGCPSAPNTKKEKWMKVEIVDDVLPIGAADISPGDLDGNGFYDPGWYICGESDWIEVPGGSEMQTFPFISAGAECPGGGATSGTIKFTYSNLPPPKK